MQPFKKMLSRRLIRVKIFQTLYAQIQQQNNHRESGLKSLNQAIQNMQNALNAAVNLPFAIADYTQTNLLPESGFLTTDPLRDQQLKLLVSDELLRNLASNPSFASVLKTSVYPWVKDPEFLFLMVRSIRNEEKFNEMCSAETITTDIQLKYLQWLIRWMLNDSEEVNQKMEESDLHWVDEKYAIEHGLTKIFKGIQPEDISGVQLPELSKDMDEDLQFARDLFALCLLHAEEYEKLIAERTPGWDPERITRTDLILMIMAIGEFLEFPFIPVKATMNEYLELAKMYSTPQSARFLNGILDKVLKDLNEEGRIQKKGRGLLG